MSETARGGRGRGRGRGLQQGLTVSEVTLDNSFDTLEPIDISDLMGMSNQQTEYQQTVDVAQDDAIRMAQSMVSSSTELSSSKEVLELGNVNPLMADTEGDVVEISWMYDPELYDDQKRIKSIICPEANEVEKMMKYYNNNNALGIATFNENLFTYIACLCANENYGPSTYKWELYTKYGTTFKGFYDSLLLQTDFVDNIVEQAPQAFATSNSDPGLRTWPPDFEAFISQKMQKQYTKDWLSNQGVSLKNADKVIVQNAYFGKFYAAIYI
jgi:hypothetical protein